MAKAAPAATAGGTPRAAEGGADWEGADGSGFERALTAVAVGLMAFCALWAVFEPPVDPPFPLEGRDVPDPPYLRPQRDAAVQKLEADVAALTAEVAGLRRDLGGAQAALRALQAGREARGREALDGAGDVERAHQDLDTAGGDERERERWRDGDETGEGDDVEFKCTGVHPPIVILTHNRAETLERVLDALLAQAGVEPGRVFVYQDGNNTAVAAVSSRYQAAHGVQHIRLPGGQYFFLSAKHAVTGASAKLRHSAQKSELAAKVSHAYFNMLGHLFSLRELAAADHVVILEDDLLPAPDFVHYFTQAACLVDRDPTVYAVSAWNDNGHWGRAADEARVFRGEHFMALGWLLPKRTWRGLLGSRDPATWTGCPDDPSLLTLCFDHWDVPFKGHLAAQRRAGEALECVYPEVPRVRHLFAGEGYSTTAALQQHWFENMALSTGEVTADFGRAEAKRYAADLARELAGAVLVHGGADAPVGCLQDTLWFEDGTFVVPIAAPDYSAAAWLAVFELLSTAVGFGGPAEGVPRGVHDGVFGVRVGTSRVLFVGQSSAAAAADERVRRAAAHGAEELRTFLVGEKGCKFPRLAPHPIAMAPAVGRLGQSCTEVCAARKPAGRCAPELFVHLNSCAVLAEHFECARCTELKAKTDAATGLGRALSKPVFHHPSMIAKDRRCVATDLRYFNCDAAVAKAQRLRPCVT